MQEGTRVVQVVLQLVHRVVSHPHIPSAPLTVQASGCLSLRVAAAAAGWYHAPDKMFVLVMLIQNAVPTGEAAVLSAPACYGTPLLRWPMNIVLSDDLVPAIEGEVIF
jgi:hypothetical protein